MRNVRSAAATRKLGATREGLLRGHQIRRDGTVRGSLIFPILNAEWPKIKKSLTERISPKR